MMVTQDEKVAARKIIRDRIGSAVHLLDKHAAFTIMDGIDDAVDTALEAAAKARR